MLNQSWFLSLIERVSGQAYHPDSAEKTLGILLGLLFALCFGLVFSLVFYHYFFHDKKLWYLFLYSVGCLVIVVFAKYALFHGVKGYIPDRLIMYALPSPKAAEWLWSLLPVAVFGIFLFFETKIIRLSAQKFLATLMVTFIFFATSVAATREGTYSIYERFTRTFWEYTGNLPLVTNVHDFLRDYSSLHASLVSHTVTHPPGFTLFLYGLQQIFDVGFFGLSFLVISSGAMVLIPLYYFLMHFLPSETTRRVIMVYVFLPSFVLLGATSMDMIFLLFTWLSISCLYRGWQKSSLFSFLGGIVAALALFGNFLFLLLAPLFLYFIYDLSRSIPKKILGLRVGLSFLGFIGFYLAIYGWTGYSIVTNFIAARATQSGIVQSNFASLSLFITFAFMNISSFFLYLGIPNCILFIKQWSLFKQRTMPYFLGFIMVLFFIALGIFQGEVERIWLFITPLFLLPISLVIKNYSERTFKGYLSLLFFQSIVIQTLFYTYW